jgi:N-acetylglucosamine-6-phosphate deacetylase
MSDQAKSVTGKSPVGGAVLQIEFTGSVITAVDELVRPPEMSTFIAPGLIDLQVNGFAGVDYNDPDSPAEAIAASLRRMFSTGVTRCLPTVITGSEARITGALANLAAAKREFQRSNLPEAEAIAGFHVEGPHLSPEDGPRGAHPLEHIRPPDIAEFHRWQEAADGGVKLVTISPEWDSAPAYISELVRNGIVASVGHTKATTEQIAAAVDAGATMSTHLGNAAHATLHKTQNYIWDQLADTRLSPSFIVDGIHIPAHFFAAAVRAKGVENSVLVSDAVMPAMCTPGPYKLGQVAVELKPNGSVVLAGGTRLAGSALRMDHAVGNAVRYGKLSLRDAIAMATVNAARVGRISARLRGLSTGEKADLVRFAWDAENFAFTVIETIVAGQLVYSA